jgi:epoxyqueuosine reductase
MTDKLGFMKRLEKKGYCASVVSIEHLEELGEEIRSLHAKGLLYDEFYHEYENPYFHPKLPKNFPNAKSIIIMAAPQPMIRTTIHWKGSTMQFIVPPTYFDGDKVTSMAKREIQKALGPKPYRLVRAVLPQKLLAVRSGLAMYGKNNITYVPEFGSFHRLTSFYTDYESPVDLWQDKKALPMCAKCKACTNACPTQAIQKDRFLIHVDRCLTYLNEKKSEIAFPKWVDPKAHNTLVGCMRCQRACPYDRKVANWYEDRGEFTEDEIAYLLKGEYKGAKAARMDKKLKSIGLDLTTFPRNLEACLQATLH